MSFTNGDFFTLGVNNKGPGNVTSSLEFWLKADVGVSGTSPVTGWVDQSGNSVSNTVNGNPSSGTNTANFNNVITFDGSGDYFLTGLTLDPNATDISAFAVYKSDGSTGSSQHIYAQQDGTGTGRSILFINDAQTDMDCFLGGGSNLSTDNITYTEWDLYAFTFNSNGASSALNFYQKGDPDGSFTITPESANGNWVVGTAKGLTSAELDGDIAELIIYSQELSSADRNKIESYLAIKYGITLDNTAGGTAGDYIASDGTTIWDASALSSYSDVIIIGRDDDSALLQKQSKSSDDSLRVYVSSLASTNQANSGSITNNVSFLAVGSDGERLRGTANELPGGIAQRLSREWVIVNKNFSDSYSLSLEWDSAGTFDITDIRLLVDDDGDFSNATVLSSSDGLTFANGSIIISGITTSHIPLNSTKYISVASASSDTPLPVDLIGFQAKNKGSKVYLEWITSSEVNNDYFVVERSRDGITYEALSIVQGNGSTTLHSEYKYVDNLPYYPVTYYRLKQVDFDGKFEYSKVVHLYTEVLQETLTISPNPCSATVTVSCRTPIKQAIQIYNHLGTNVSNSCVVQYQSDYRVNIDLSNLTRGIYILQMGNTHQGILLKN